MVLSEDQCLFRVKGSLEFTCQLESTDEALVREAVSGTFQHLRHEVRSKSLVLSVCHSPVLIWPNKGPQVIPEEFTPDTRCRDLPLHVQGNGMGNEIKKVSKKKEKKNPSASVTNMKLMMEVTEPGDLSPLVLWRENRKHHFLCAALPMDCVVCVHKDEGLGVTCVKLVEALCSQLSEMETVTLQHMKGAAMLIPQPFHFLLPEPAGLLTVIYPAGVPDCQLEPQRQALHSLHGLPMDRPCLRRANAFHFPDHAYTDGYLQNPHAHLPHPTREGIKVYLVRGSYSYYHYMQDRVDDNGWGCAYRSLQTICSWFQQQGYVDRPIPTHREIQQALVDVGDKPSSFVGSRQWIGSIEVNAVLNQLLDVTSKIMFVSRGSELASKGRELANHFTTEGTPVMIGGGVLAHTILGVAWSETTGQIQFLILDPHYTGGEDLQLITDKGWCGWKGPEFWEQNAYYNLCLPQCPKVL